MPISWNEIRSRAVSFSNEWKESYREEADAQPFLVEFLNIFGITRKRVATFEHRVKKIDDAKGYIDLLWPGTLLVEMKSRGENLEKAYIQAKNYCHGLKEFEVPPQIIICDFETFHVYDENGVLTHFELSKLVDHIHLFSNIAGYQKRAYKEQDPVNIEAAELMGKLHDKLKEIGYEGHNLELYLVRLLFILFADDTNIFEKGIFLDYLQLRTKEDGSDLGMHIDALFSVLNQPQEKRLKTLDDQINSFPYVNGKLFEERLPHASFDSEMRNMLLTCCTLNWGKISPAIFGSLFQSVMDEKARRNLGAHYTSEKNILKVIKPLFLDDLIAQLNNCGRDKRKLRELHHKISKLRFLDPACGCGNFLITAYKELRLLELEIVKLLLNKQTITNISHYFLVDVDQFYGIEYEEFPSQIAQVAMWLIDHQMNMLASETFGEYMPRIPLRKSAVVIHGNALKVNWNEIIQPFEGEIEAPRFHYILGNPPFVGKHLQNEEQKEDLLQVIGDSSKAGILDYVSGWYIKAAQYMKSYQPNRSVMPYTVVAFVSTSSIAQGEQVGVLWGKLSTTYKCSLFFAHQTFKWSNEAKGMAAVHVIIEGFTNIEVAKKRLFSYETLDGEATENIVKNINPYLSDGPTVILNARRKPLCKVPEMLYGSKPVDGGHFLLTEQEKELFIQTEPNASKWIRPLLSGDEFLNGRTRWVLYLKNCPPGELTKMPKVIERVKAVRDFRLASTKKQTQDSANTPTLFAEERQPKNDFILIPTHSSENRTYIPFGFFTPEFIVHNSCTALPNANLYIFGIISSRMHMTWVRYTCGRLESRYRYSNTLVYNNFPWPLNPSVRQKEQVEIAAQLVLDCRLQFPNSTLADLYDPFTMPSSLIKAHQKLDKAVDTCYRSQPFLNELKRIEFLFSLYDQYVNNLFSDSNQKPNKK